MMIAAAAAVLAIVVQDHSSLRAEARSTSAEQAVLWQGDVLEVRGRRGDYLQVYDYHRERGGFVQDVRVRGISLEPAKAPELLTVVRFLRETAGAETLGISYAAAYLRAVPASALTAEPLDAIGSMAERLAERASNDRSNAAPGIAAAHLEVVSQFGLRMTSFERNGHVQVCYDGDMFRRVLAMPSATADERARAALGLTRDDCRDPDLGPSDRHQFDLWRAQLLDQVPEANLPPPLRSRIHARRAGVWSALAFESARRGEPSRPAAERAVGELSAVDAGALGEDNRGVYTEASVRVGAIRWAAADARKGGALTVHTAPGETGQTCVLLEDARRADNPPLIQRCTYGIVWTASARSSANGAALTLAVQPLETWSELWLFHRGARGWTVDVLPPGANDPDLGYVEFAGWTPGAKRMLIVREVRDKGHFRRRFEEVRVDTMTTERQASAPELLADFGRWQDPAWRRDSVALR